MDQYRMFFIQIQTLPQPYAPKTSQNKKVVYAKQPTPDPKVMLSGGEL